MNDPQTGEVGIAVELGQRAEVDRFSEFLERVSLGFRVAGECCGSSQAVEELLNTQKRSMSIVIIPEGQLSLNKRGLPQ